MASSPQSTSSNPVLADSNPGTPEPRSEEKVSQESLFQKVVLVPDSSKKDIPRILGKGGFNIKNLVKYSAKKWYDNHSVDDADSPEGDEATSRVRAPHIKVNLLHDEEDGLQFVLESSCELMVNCAKEACSEFVEKLSSKKNTSESRGKSSHPLEKKRNPNQSQGHRNNFSDKVMKQFFRVEMDPTMLGKLIGKGGSRVQQMVEYVIAKDFDKAGAKGVKIFVKEQTAPLADNKCIDLEEFGDGSEKYVLFIATVGTRNLYATMRNVEKAIEKNINRSSFDVSENDEQSSRDRATAEKMFEEATGDYGGW